MSNLLNEKAIKEAAYYIWKNAGCPENTSMSDWNAAIQQLTNASKNNSTLNSKKTSSCKTSTCKTTSLKKTLSKDRKLRFETLQLHVGQEQPDPATGARAVPTSTSIPSGVNRTAAA